MADVRKVARLLGGSRVLERRIRTAIDLHEVLERGLPLQSLQFFVENRRHLATEDVLEFVLGRRRKAHRCLPVRLGRHQTDRLFVLADALANAADVIRSMRKAEKWVVSPLEPADMGGRRPLDLLTTSIGEKIVIQEIAEAELMMRVGKAAAEGMKDINEGRYTVIRNREELGDFIKGISRRVAQKYQRKSVRKRNQKGSSSR